MNIWLISDTHFGHDNMVPYCGRPVDFDRIIIENWKRMVARNDLVIHLGDVIMGENAEGRLGEILPALPGRKILCRGNHDTEKKWGTGVGFMEKGFDFVTDSFVYDRYAFSHCPITPLPSQQNFHWKEQVICNFHGHFHNKFPKNTEKQNNDLYDTSYFLANQDKYQLIQIEDTLRPFSLEESIGMWLSKGGEENEV